MSRIVVERIPEVEPRRFYVVSAEIQAHGHTGGCLGCAALASHGRATKPHNSECRERFRTIIERTLTGNARMNTFKDRVAEITLEIFFDENEPWLLTEIPNRDPVFATQILERHSASSDRRMKKFMSLRECLHVMMQCCMRQHFCSSLLTA